VLVSWNGLMIDSMARAGAALNDSRYTSAARAAADFLWENLRREDGRLLHTWRHGKSRLDAYLDDYTCLINALVSVYEATFDETYIDRAVELADAVLELFGDSSGEGFFYTAADHEQLIARTKDVQDSSVPSGNSMAAMGLLRLGKLTGRREYLDAAEGAMRAALPILDMSPIAASAMLLALDVHMGPAQEIALVAPAADEQTNSLVNDLCSRFIPRKVVALRTFDEAEQQRSAHLDPLFAGKQPVDGKLAAYVCENFSCKQPAVGADEIRTTWDGLQRAKYAETSGVVLPATTGEAAAPFRRLAVDCRNVARNRQFIRCRQLPIALADASQSR